tara:strand:- start:520 stop:1023 length:504 start_codon:yes stop_codon:yes gene_type:complete
MKKLSKVEHSIKIICIDSKRFRQRILRNKIYNIEYVPCIIIINDNVTIYQGVDASSFIKDKISMIRETKKQSNRLQNDYNLLLKQSEYDKRKILHLENSLELYKSKLQNQTSELTTMNVPTNTNTNMRTSIEDILNDSDSEDENEGNNSIVNQSVQELAQQLQEGRK